MTERLPLRGGNWNNGSNAGLGALNLNNPRSNSNTNIGFRPALDLRRLCGLTGPCASTEQKEPCPCPRTNTAELPAASTQRLNVAGGFIDLMPKTHNHLWPRITSWDNLYAAYLEARRGKRYAADVVAFTEHLEEQLITIHNELAWKTWRPSLFTAFTVREPKVREISAPPFRDRVVHHALVRVLEPLFERRFIDHSYACRKERGTHAAVRRVQRLVRSAPQGSQFFQGDIKSYFPSVHHDILKAIIRRTIRDRDALWLIDEILDGHHPGLPIGALTSQLFANVYLDQLDHYVTDELGIGAYTRYMDDFVIVSASRPHLRGAENEIRRFCRERLALDLNPKSRTVAVSRGIDFCGYRIFRHHLLPRKRNTKRARKRLRAQFRRALRTGNFERFRGALMSHIGYMGQCNGHRTLRSTLNHITQTGGQR